MRRAAWRWLKNPAIAEAAALEAQPSTSHSVASYFTWTRSNKSRILVPLNNPLPGVVDSAGHQPAATDYPPTECTQLPNGVRILSEATPGPSASLGLFVDSGSIYESPSTSGASAMLECLAYKATRHRTSPQILQEIERLGANITANASREQMLYGIDSLKSYLPQVTELLCDAVVNPAMDPEEIEEQKLRMGFLLSSPDFQQSLLPEKLVCAVYEGAYSRPLIPDVQQLQRLDADAIRQFVQQHYTGPRVVLAAAGVEHQQLVELAEPMLAVLPSTSGAVEPPSQYAGGYVHMPGANPQANLILSFEYKGGWRDVKGAVVMTVLTFLLGGGSSFSSGGPGKGMHSRLYTRVLNQHHWVHSCSAFSSTFNSSGLVGIQASCEPRFAANMLAVMCHELESLLHPTGSVELERAKRAATSMICNALESKATSAEDIGRQMLTYGQRYTGAQYVDMMAQVTAEDIVEFVQRLLVTKPSLAAYGDGTDNMYKEFEQLEQRYEALRGLLQQMQDSAWKRR